MQTNLILTGRGKIFYPYFTFDFPQRYWDKSALSRFGVFKSWGHNLKLATYLPSGSVFTKSELLPETMVHFWKVMGGGSNEEEKGDGPGWAGDGGLWLAATWQHLDGWQDPGGGHRMCRGAPSLARTFQAPPWQGGREITGPPRKAVKWDNGGTLVTWEVRGLPIQIPHKLPLLVLP